MHMLKVTAHAPDSLKNLESTIKINLYIRSKFFTCTD